MSRSLQRVLLVGLVLSLVTAGTIFADAFFMQRKSWDEQQPGAIDIGFAQFMLTHHDQAVVMTQIVLAHPDSALGSMAAAMHDAQLMESGQMRGWLLLWNRPLLPAARNPQWMLSGNTTPSAELLSYIAQCGASAAGMPGMASRQELNQLRQFKGAQRDGLFLRLMINHHQGGLPMARLASSQAHLASVRALATQMVLDQTAQLNRMRALLAHQGESLSSP